MALNFQNLLNLFEHTEIFYFDFKDFLTIVDSVTKFALKIPVIGKSTINVCDVLDMLIFFTGFVEKSLTMKWLKNF